MLLHRDYSDWETGVWGSGESCCCQKEGLLNRRGGLRKKGAWKEGKDLAWRTSPGSQGRFWTSDHFKETDAGGCSGTLAGDTCDG